MLKLPKDNNVNQFITVDYDTDYNCDEGCEDYCRCSTISNTEVRSTVNNAFGLAQALGLPIPAWDNKNPNISLEDVVDFMFVKQLLSSGRFRTQTYSGYYGEELGPTTFEPGCNLDLYNLEVLASKLHASLIMEHKFLPKAIKDVDNWMFAEVPTALVEVSNNSLNKERVEDYKSHLKYHPGSEKYFAPICLTVGGKFRIVDGNHRFTAMPKKDTCLIIKEKP